jgi:hypothetical protein
MHVRFWLTFVLSCAIAIVASSARADSAAVTVLGVRSLDGDDQLERRISQALRGSVRGIDGYRVSDREVSLAQMSLAHGCEEVDPPCLKDIAATLAADRLVYGNLVRSGDKIRISLFNFDARSGQIDGSAERTTLASLLVEPGLSELTSDLAQRIAGKRSNAVGVLRITGNRPGAEVSLDGQPAGTLDERGELVLNDVREGPHTLLVVTSDGRDRRELSVDVRRDTTTNLRALLTPPLPTSVDQDQPGPVASEAPPDPDRTPRIKRILGYTSAGIALGFAAATIYSWVRIQAIEDSGDLKAYADAYPKSGPGSTSDVCPKAIDGTQASLYAMNPGNTQAAKGAALEPKAADLCKEGDKLETLQWVFVGGTLAFAGVGTWLLWSGYHDKPKTLSLSPSFGIQSASMRATLRF